MLGVAAVLINMALPVRYPAYHLRFRFTSATAFVPCGTLLLCSFLIGNPLVAQSTPQFEKQVLPILGKYCLSCHGAAMQMAKLFAR